MGERKERPWVVISLLAAGSVLALLLAPFAGMEGIHPEAVLDSLGDSGDYRIFWRIRVPRVLLAWLAGSGLALAGMTFQSLFRNPLATPFTLGVSAGAAFGAAVAIRLGLVATLAGLSGVSVAAFIGAVLAIALVYGLTRLKRGFSTATMLLAGVAVSFLFSSVILFIQYVSNFSESYRIIRWLMGGLDVVGFDSVSNVAPFVLVGGIMVLYHHRELNLLSTGEDLAASRGVSVSRVRKTLFVATSLLVGSVVAVCGPIGFIGMMSPHICRLLVGPEHRLLSLATVLLGGLFLVVADLFARTVIAPAEIPVGIITALLGGPFFLYLLLRGDSERGLL